ncbi:MAG: DUF1559 domain-containing protein [Planctomycetaceae bacterium]|jgi:prepilin-type N-terminal cleavage/methylation domain-containing protein|nr:DUF1559 domain-containing protein [Planctomycetaceae bacterium]
MKNNICNKNVCTTDSLNSCGVDIQKRKPCLLYYGFTLVELLVVIAIIGVLIAILLPAVQAAREAAKRMTCESNLKNVALAAHTFHDTYKTLPPGGGGVYNARPTWAVHLFPYIEQEALLNAVNANPRWENMGIHSSNNNAIQGALAGIRIKVYTCPSNGDINSTFTYGGVPYKHHNYVCCAGNAGWPNCNQTGTTFSHWTNLPIWSNTTESADGSSVLAKGGMFAPGTRGLPEYKPKMAEVRDGLSNTLMFSETIQGQWQNDGSDANNDCRGLIWWAYTTSFSGYIPPNSTSPDQVSNFGGAADRSSINDKFPTATLVEQQALYLGARSHHNGGVNSARGDASVKFTTNSVNRKFWQALSSSAGGDSTGDL